MFCHTDTPDQAIGDKLTFPALRTFHLNATTVRPKDPKAGLLYTKHGSRHTEGVLALDSLAFLRLPPFSQGTETFATLPQPCGQKLAQPAGIHQPRRGSWKELG